MTFLEAMRAALDDALLHPDVLLCGQLVKYGLGGLTTGLYEKHGERVFTLPVSENLMHAAAMGLALAGKRPIVVNERMDFLALAMDPLLNHIPIWPTRAEMSLPVVVMAVVGKNKGQGPQHSKNFTPWFRMMEGWTVVEPDAPDKAYSGLLGAIFGDSPVLYVVHREFFSATDEVKLPRPNRVGLCGASERHERAFYRD
jgi:pyruvate/2-oxoglutarate/acetoin dehydrogenase E1 component